MPPKINPDTQASDNILKLYTFLQVHTQPISLTELTKKFEVSKPTMSRYLKKLESSNYAKLQVEERGKEHFYTLDRPQKLPQLSLSVDGLQQLALCRDFISHLLPTNMKQAIEIALNQAIAYLPQDTQNPLQGLPHIASSFTRGKIDYSKHQQILKTLLTATRDKAVCIVTYKSSYGEQSFDYAPKKVVALNEAIHINGWKVTGKGKVTTIKEHPHNLLLHRIQSVELTRRTSENVPEIIEHEEGYFGFMRDEEVFEATIIFYDNAATYVSERVWSSKQIITQIDDDCIEITLTAQSAWELKSWILSFGDRAKIIAPDWLKSEIIENMQNLQKMHEEE